MPVISINVGAKRVHLTAYCPDDELGLLACDYVLARVAELLDGTNEIELRRWLTQRDPGIAELFAKLDAGWKLPKTGDFTVDPSNAPAEARIIRHLLRERIEQCAGRPTHEVAMDAAGPIVAPRGLADGGAVIGAMPITTPGALGAAPSQGSRSDIGAPASRISACCRDKDVPADSGGRGQENKEVEP